MQIISDRSNDLDVNKDENDYKSFIFLFTDCGGCNVKFSHPLYYRLHCNVFHDPHYSLTIRKYHCKICGLAVLGKENIVKHASTEHDGRGAYQCQYCNKVFYL